MDRSLLCSVSEMWFSGRIHTNERRVRTAVSLVEDLGSEAGAFLERRCMRLLDSSVT